MGLWASGGCWSTLSTPLDTPLDVVSSTLMPPSTDIPTCPPATANMNHWRSMRTMAAEATVTSTKGLPPVLQWSGITLTLPPCPAYAATWLSPALSHPVYQGCLLQLWPCCQVTTSHWPGHLWTSMYSATQQESRFLPCFDFRSVFRWKLHVSIFDLIPS